MVTKIKMGVFPIVTNQMFLHMQHVHLDIVATTHGNNGVLMKGSTTFGTVEPNIPHCIITHIPWVVIQCGLGGKSCTFFHVLCCVVRLSTCLNTHQCTCVNALQRITLM